MQFKHHHVSLSVNDIEKSAIFYAHFGFQKIFDTYIPDKKYRLAHLRLNEIFIELFRFDNRPPPIISSDLLNDLKRGGIRHFALRVDNLKTAKIWVEKNLSQTVKICHGNSNIDYFFIRDPDGNFVEIVEDNRLID